MKSNKESQDYPLHYHGIFKMLIIHQCLPESLSGLHHLKQKSKGASARLVGVSSKHEHKNENLQCRTLSNTLCAVSQYLS